MSSVKKAKVSPAAPPPRSSPRKNPSAGRKGDDEEVEEKNIWLDPDALSVECGICFMPFETDVFMCTNGQAACAKCCDRMRNCGCCGLPIGDLRCLPAEKMLAEMNTVCKFSKYGCTEVIKYAEKRRHEESCQLAPCGCPVAGCTYRGMLLCSHVLEDHARVVSSVAYLQSTTVTLPKAAPFLVLVLERVPDSGEGEGSVFALLNGGDVLAGRSLSLVCFGAWISGTRWRCAAACRACSRWQGRRRASASWRGSSPRSSSSFPMPTGGPPAPSPSASALVDEATIFSC
ncbi:unnamed protein product [Urochloa humidicola]